MISAPTLTTDRLVLRGPEPQDWEATAEFWASERSRFVGGPKSRLDAWQSFAARWGHWALRGFGMFTVCRRDSDRIIGVVGPLYPDTWVEPEIGWVLYEGAEGQGIGFEAAVAARSHAYDTLGWPTAVSYIDPENTRSIALAERLGCRRDEGAAHPFGEAPCHVYRHPAPEAVR